MKRIVFFVAMMVFASCEAEEIISVSDMPFDKNYTVYLANDFERKENWNEVDPEPQSILDLLLSGIAKYVAANFADYYKVVKFSKERPCYDTGKKAEFRFNSSGGFTGFDD